MSNNVGNLPQRTNSSDDIIPGSLADSGKTEVSKLGAKKDTATQSEVQTGAWNYNQKQVVVTQPAVGNTKISADKTNEKIPQNIKDSNSISDAPKEPKLPIDKNIKDLGDSLDLLDDIDSSLSPEQSSQTDNLTQAAPMPQPAQAQTAAKTKEVLEQVKGNLGQRKEAGVQNRQLVQSGGVLEAAAQQPRVGDLGRVTEIVNGRSTADKEAVASVKAQLLNTAQAKVKENPNCDLHALAESAFNNGRHIVNNVLYAPKEILDKLRDEFNKELVETAGKGGKLARYLIDAGIKEIRELFNEQINELKDAIKDFVKGEIERRKEDSKEKQGEYGPEAKPEELKAAQQQASIKKEAERAELTKEAVKKENIALEMLLNEILEEKYIKEAKQFLEEINDIIKQGSLEQKEIRKEDAKREEGIKEAKKGDEKNAEIEIERVFCLLKAA